MMCLIYKITYKVYKFTYIIFNRAFLDLCYDSCDLTMDQQIVCS